MRYYRLLDDLKDRWFLQAPEFNKGESIWDFVTTGPLLPLSYIPEVRIRHKGHRVNVTFADFDLVIVDSTAKNCFPDKDVQFHRVSIGGADDREYNIMNIVHAIDCLNEELSEFDKYKADDEIRSDLAGSYKTIYKMVIDPKSVGEHDIFRLANYEVAVIVSETLKDSLCNKKITGITFKEV